MELIMGNVMAVGKCEKHEFSKSTTESITLIQGEGVEGDAHRGVTVKHRSRVAVDPTQANLRQVHLIHFELIEELREKGFKVSPATMGENITTRGIDLLSLPRGTKLKIGSEAVIEVTGLRNPCVQLDHYQKGLLKAVLGRDAEGNLIRKTGVMGIVEAGGIINLEDLIEVLLPPKPYKELEPV